MDQIVRRNAICAMEGKLIGATGAVVATGTASHSHRLRRGGAGWEFSDYIATGNAARRWPEVQRSGSRIPNATPVSDLIASHDGSSPLKAGVRETHRKQRIVGADPELARPGYVETGETISSRNSSGTLLKVI